MKTIFGIYILCSLLISSTVIASASTEVYILSTQNDANLGGLSFQEDDVVKYDATTGSATIFFEGDNFTSNENIDALHIMNNGDRVMVISTTLTATLGGVTFKDGDLVQYDPISNTASLWFSEDEHFKLTEDIDALSILDNGHIVFSTDNNAKLETGTGYFDVKAGDLVDYDPIANTATTLFDETLFGRQMNIDAVHIQADGSILLSTAVAATLGGLSFDEDDLVLYNLNSCNAELAFNGSLHFSLGENIDAVSMAPVPIPGAIWILGSSLAALGVVRRRGK
ncbi:MAG: VPLPA-CTERM sorting domain-containing protein [Thermodesulfobacteriota bacterium]|nr:VPLPA-CTERM sorting domain-containing protein [Thermodesulfobacteriota bacterium]